MTQLAIIGMDAKFSGLDNIDQVERAFYQGKLIANQLSALIEQTPLSKQINQSLTILAQQVNGDAAQLTLVLLGKGDNELLDSTLVDSSEINAKSVVTSANLADALAKIVTLTKKGEMVALIAVHQVRVYDKNSGNMSDGNMSFGADFSQYQPCSGLASLLFGANNASTSSSASHSGAHYVYGVVKGFASGSDIKNTARQAMINSGVTSSDIALLEVSALGDATYSEQESHALMNAYNEGSDNPLQTAISSARCISGEAGNLSQLLGLIKTVICLQQRYLPGNAVWQAPHEHALQAWQQSAFYFPVDSRPWYPNKDGSPHCAAYSCLSVDSRLSVNQQGRTDYCHIILQESVIEEPGQRHPLSDIRRNGYFANSDCVITVLRGVSESQLQDALQRVAQLCQSMSLKDIAKQCYRDFDETKSYAGSYQIALLAESVADLLSEIKQATTGISLAFEKNSDWKTPKGSYFTSVPAQQGQQDGVTFLYPGIGATYVGLGRDLFHLFPEIYQPVANLADDIGASLKDTLLNPRSIVAHSFNELKQLDLELRGNLANIAEAGVGFA
ncbi:MAG: PfaB family protein, partial [Psychrobium sp.]|nr:PfaB family protein [Psychrobium sp.]